MGMGKVERKGGKENKTPTIPFPMFLVPKSCQQTWRAEKGVLVGQGDIKATDFLTSPLPGLPTFNLCIWEPGLGMGRMRGSGGGGSALSSQKVQAPPPLSWLRERPGGF